jgi:hypothetical protein
MRSSSASWQGESSGPVAAPKSERARFPAVHPCRAPRRSPAFPPILRPLLPRGRSCSDSGSCGARTYTVHPSLPSSTRTARSGGGSSMAAPVKTIPPTSSSFYLLASDSLLELRDQTRSLPPQVRRATLRWQRHHRLMRRAPAPLPQRRGSPLWPSNEQRRKSTTRRTADDITEHSEGGREELGRVGPMRMALLRDHAGYGVDGGQRENGGCAPRCRCRAGNFIRLLEETDKGPVRVVWSQMQLT